MAAMPAAMSSGSIPASKNVSRILQTAILQLCNEHVHYNCRLQIVGVLCLTIDDQEDELVVKINNTLKRMNPTPAEKAQVPVSGNYSRSQSDAVLTTATSHKVPIPKVHQSAQKHSVESGRNNHSVGINYLRERISGTPVSTSIGHHGTSNVKTTPSPHKGRKRSTPVKVSHVIDEGELMNECGDDDQDVVTVIPQAPESSETDADINQADLEPCLESAKPILIAPLDDLQDGIANNEEAIDESVHGIINVRSISDYNNSSYSEQGNGPCQNGKSKNGQQVGNQADKELFDYVEDLMGCDGLSDTMSLHNSHQNVSPIQIAPEISESSSAEGSGFNSHSGASAAVTFSKASALNNLGQLAIKKGTVALIPINALKTSKGPVSLLKSRSAAAMSSSSSSDNKRTTSRIREMLLKGQVDDDDLLQPHKIQRVQKSESPSPTKTSPTRRHDRLRDSLKPEEIKQYFGKRETPADIKLQCKMDHCSAPPFMDLDEYFSHTWLAHNCYNCHECGKVFMNKAGIMRHRPIHTGIKRFACNFCKADFHRMDKCKLHVAKHMKGADKGKPIVVGKHIKVLA